MRFYTLKSAVVSDQFKKAKQDKDKANRNPIKDSSVSPFACTLFYKGHCNTSGKSNDWENHQKS